MYKLVVFDLDGTLLNTLEDLKEAYNRVYRKLGYRDVTMKEMRDNLGYGNRRLFQDTYRIINNEEVSEKELDLMVSMWIEEYEGCYLDKTEEYEGITRLLQFLQTKGVKLGVISNKKDEFTKKLIEKYFKGIEFVDVIGDSLLYPRKPDPTSLLSLANKASVSISDTLFVGDSENDYKVALNAGSDSLLVSWGFRDREFLEKFQATYLVDNVEEIIKLF